MLKSLYLRRVSLRLALVSNSFSSTSDVGIVIISKSSYSGESFLFPVGFNGEDGGPELLLFGLYFTFLTSGAIFRFFGLGVANGERSIGEDRCRSSSVDNSRI